MSQESNTGNSSSGKKKLVLRKKGESKSPEPAAEQPAEKKPIRMSLKRSPEEIKQQDAEPTKEHTPPVVPVPTDDALPPIPPAAPAAPEPEPEPEKPKMKLGLKRDSEPEPAQAEPEEPTPPPAPKPPARQTPPPPAEPEATEPPKKKVKLGLKRGASNESSEPTPPKDDMSWGLSEEEQNASDDIPSAGPAIPQAGPPPPVASSSTPPMGAPPIPPAAAGGPPPPPSGGPPPPPGTPPPPPAAAGGPPPPPPGVSAPPIPGAGAPPPPPPTGAKAPPPVKKAAPDLVDQELSQKPSHTKHIVIAAGILIFLLVAIVAVGIMLFSGSKDEVAPEPIAAETTETKKPERIADIPKSSIDQAKAVVAQVNEKSSTDEILGGSEPATAKASMETPAAPAPVSVVAEPAPIIEGPRAVVYDQQDPEVLDWVENLSGMQFGRGKMILNGQTYQAGAVVEPTMQIRWIGEDKALGLLYFEDANGVKYEKEF